MTIESKSRRKGKADAEPVLHTYQVDGKVLSAILFYQCVANGRRISLQKRYMALAKDLTSLSMGETPTASKELLK